MRFGAGGLIGLGVAVVLAALIGSAAATTESDSDTYVPCSSAMTLVEDDPDAEIPSEDLDHLLTPAEGDEEGVELLPYWMGGREMLENVRFDLGDEFS